MAICRGVFMKIYHLHILHVCTFHLRGKTHSVERKREEYTLNIRMNGQRDDWRHKRFERSLVGEHFCSSGHDFLSHASVCCLESNPEWTDNARKSRESYWIRRLNTLNPSGINKGD